MAGRGAAGGRPCTRRDAGIWFHSSGDWRDRVARTPPEMLQGTVDILILRTLAWEPMHGYAISRWLDARSDGVLSVDGAALYQALHRLENRKWVRASWGLSENNRKAKYYTLTAAGKGATREPSRRWGRARRCGGQGAEPRMRSGHA